jgi:hypothetical protein
MSSGKEKRRGGGRPRGRRNPKAGARVVAAKKPAPGAPLDDNPTIVWGFGLLRLDGRWGCAGMSPAHATELLGLFREWEKLRAGEFFGGGRRGHKFIAIENLSPEAQKELERLQLDDLDGLWELHVSGKERIWGARLEHVFYPLWWDPDHEVCPSRKRNT